MERAGDFDLTVFAIQLRHISYEGEMEIDLFNIVDILSPQSLEIGGIVVDQDDITFQAVGVVAEELLQMEVDDGAIKGT